MLAGLVTFYGLFFPVLGVTEIVGLDLRQIGNVAVPVAIVPLFCWDFLSSSWTLGQSSSCGQWPSSPSLPPHTGRMAAQWLGAILLVVATYTFFLPIIIMALGNDIP